eukprot:172772-Rhodomonas_salina.15
MLSCDYWLPETLHECASVYLSNRVKVSLEYDSRRYITVYNVHELSIICRLVCEYHNEMSAAVEDDGWLGETTSIWESMVFPMSPISNASPACDTVDSAAEKIDSVAVVTVNTIESSVNTVPITD